MAVAAPIAAGQILDSLATGISAAETPLGAPPVKFDGPTRGEMIYRPLGRTGERGVGAGPRRLPHRQAEGRAGKHPHRSRGHRSRHQLHGQLLGLQRRRQRNTHGQSPPRRLPAEGLPDDQDRRPHQGSRAAQQIDESLGRLADRSLGSAPVSRDHPPGRPRSDFRAGRGDRGDASRAEGGQDPLHRLYRPQGSAGPPADAGCRRPSTTSISMPCRCR